MTADPTADPGAPADVRGGGPRLPERAGTHAHRTGQAGRESGQRQEVDERRGGSQLAGVSIIVHVCVCVLCLNFELCLPQPSEDEDADGEDRGRSSALLQRQKDGQ